MLTNSYMPLTTNTAVKIVICDTSAKSELLSNAVKWPHVPEAGTK